MSFPLKGNDGVRLALKNALSSDRLPHAILLEGEEGLGKHTLSSYIAKAAVCSETSAPCGSCKDCHLADSANHPDISIVSPEEGKKNILVAQIRSLRAEAFIKPHTSNRKVFIIDGAEKMNESAQNAFLKVLEEPPEGVVFILLVLSRSMLLETVVSRCVTFSLSTPPAKEAAEVLIRAANISADEAHQVLLKTGGNIGKALTMLSGKKKESISAAAALRFTELIFNGSELDMLKLFIPLEKNRPAAQDFFTLLSVNIAHMLRNKNIGTARARVLTRLYSDIPRYNELLKKNVNLSLLFTAVVRHTRQLQNK